MTTTTPTQPDTRATWALLAKNCRARMRSAALEWRVSRHTVAKIASLAWAIRYRKLALTYEWQANYQPPTKSH
jgi:hypothetical protein